MTTLYMVTDGCYSDYRICGIYSTPEKAAHAKLLFNADNEIEEIELDAVPSTPPGLLPWNVKMDKNGNTDRVYRDSAETSPSYEWAPYGDAYASFVLFRIWARDEDHAIKIANEKRVALIASGEWTTDWNAWCRRRKTEQAD